MTAAVVGAVFGFYPLRLAATDSVGLCFRSTAATSLFKDIKSLTLKSVCSQNGSDSALGWL
jgi:hypothetical protein